MMCSWQSLWFKLIELATVTHQLSDEGSDYQSHSSSSSECGGDDLDLFCAGPLELKEEEKQRKSVRFADDCGQDLYMIRVASEPSDCPPKLSPSVLRRYRGDSFEEETVTREPAPVWNLMFKQPAADYVHFRENLENVSQHHIGFYELPCFQNKCSLENVILNNEGYKVLGTIKVSNISFEKSVFIRYTMNGWISYIDKAACYQPSTSKVYDTFKFDIDLPSSVEKVSKSSELTRWQEKVRSDSPNWVLHLLQSQRHRILGLQFGYQLRASLRATGRSWSSTATSCFLVWQVWIASPSPSPYLVSLVRSILIGMMLTNLTTTIGESLPLGKRLAPMDRTGRELSLLTLHIPTFFSSTTTGTIRKCPGIGDEYLPPSPSDPYHLAKLLKHPSQLKPSHKTLPTTVIHPFINRFISFSNVFACVC